MITALSYAFSTDLRAEFRDLNFPICDETYEELMGMVTDISEFDNQILSNFELSQNYSNPFNPSTTFKYTLPKASDVILTIYDINGRALETLINSRKNAGYHTVQWNAEQYSSGVYFYRIEAGDFQQVKKCLLIK